MFIYNRKTQETINEKVFKSKGIDFYYKTTLGGFLRLFARLRFVSKICSIFYKRKKSKKKIQNFIDYYNIDMTDYESDYNSFNDFFIRERTTSNIDHTPKHLIAPADSCVLALNIKNDTIYTIKNKNYTLTKFLKNKQLAQEYEGGVCLIFRLRAYDFHRFCYVDDGGVLKQKHIRGFLDSVNINATGKFTLSSNYRQVSQLATQNFGNIIVAEIGAMLVGQIVQTHKETIFSRGDEKGYFEFGGSSIVILLKKDIIKIDDDILKYSSKNIETLVKQGERVGVKYE